MIPAPDIMTPDQGFIDLNLLEEDDQNWQIVIDHDHNQDHNIFPLSDALAANAIVVTKTRKPLKKSKS